MTNEHRSDLTASIIASSRRPANLGAVPEGAVSLAMGEPFAETPDAVVKSAVASLQPGRTRYAPQTGEPALRHALAAAIPGAKAVIVCTPSNPTGRVIPKADLVALRGLADAAGTVLVSDEAYADIVFDGADAASVLSLARSVESICIGTFSKSYAMTGWRLG